jgi:hypothetical protein
MVEKDPKLIQNIRDAEKKKARKRAQKQRPTINPREPLHATLDGGRITHQQVKNERERHRHIIGVSD